MHMSMSASVPARVPIYMAGAMGRSRNFEFMIKCILIMIMRAQLQINLLFIRARTHVPSAGSTRVQVDRDVAIDVAYISTS